MNDLYAVVILRFFPVF